MATVNKVILVGNCGRDAEVRTLPSGQPVANVSLATTMRRKNKQTGQYEDDTQWHRITFYDRLAEVARDYVKKGRSIYVEGRLKYGKYTDAQGMERNTVDIIATDLTLLGGRSENGGGDYGGGSSYGGGAAQAAPRPAATIAPQQQPAQAAGGMGGGFDADDDIPF